MFASTPQRRTSGRSRTAAQGPKRSLTIVTRSRLRASSIWTSLLRCARARAWIRSRVGLDALAVGPLGRLLGRHALDRLGVHVDDDVLADHLGGLAVGRPSIAR